jgi:hypothetical protein
LADPFFHVFIVSFADFCLFCPVAAAVSVHADSIIGSWLLNSAHK